MIRKGQIRRQKERNNRSPCFLMTSWCGSRPSTVLPRTIRHQPTPTLGVQSDILGIGPAHLTRVLATHGRTTHSGPDSLERRLKPATLDVTSLGWHVLFDTFKWSAVSFVVFSRDDEPWPPIQISVRSPSTSAKPSDCCGTVVLCPPKTSHENVT